MIRWLMFIALMGASVSNVYAEDILEGYHPFPFGEILNSREITWFELDGSTYLSLIQKPNSITAEFSHFVTVYDSGFHAIHSGRGNLEGMVFRGGLQIANQDNLRIVLTAYRNQLGELKFLFISPSGVRAMRIMKGNP